MDNLSFKYSFKLADGSEENFEFIVNAETLRLVIDIPRDPPSWINLEYHQCPNCPLDRESTVHCPLAVNIAPVVERFSRVLSYENVHVKAIENNRVTSQETSAQMGVSSLIGLLIATSGCPFTDFLKPMVRFHLPFATEEETLWRATSTYLLAKYYLKKKGCNPEIELKGLSEIYENIGLVNVAIIKRLQAATEKDSTLNALVVLDVFATSLSLEVEEFWAENEHIFMPFLKSCIEKEEKKIN
jgi:hypothetical protein